MSLQLHKLVPGPRTNADAWKWGRQELRFLQSGTSVGTGRRLWNTKTLYLQKNSNNNNNNNNNQEVLPFYVSYRMSRAAHKSKVNKTLTFRAFQV